MHASFKLTATIAALLCSSTTFSGTAVAEPSFAVASPSHAALLIRGAANLELRLLPKDETYVLAKVTPQPRKNADDSYTGVIQIISLLQGSVERMSWTYNWRSASSEHLSPDELILYVKGGTVVCKISKQDRSAYGLQPIRLIPEQWQPFIASAFTYQRTHPISATSPKNFQEAEKLLGGPNPVLATTAFRRVIEGEKFDVSFVLDSLQSADEFQAAVYVYLLARNVNVDSVRETEMLLSRVIESVNDVTTLRGIDAALKVIVEEGRGAERGGVRLFSSSASRLHESLQVKRKMPK